MALYSPRLGTALTHTGGSLPPALIPAAKFAARARYLWGYQGELLNPVGLGGLLSVWLEGVSVIRRKKKEEKNID